MFAVAELLYSRRVLQVAVLALIFLFVPESRDDEDLGRLDFAGATLATLTLGGIVFGLIESSRLGFRDSSVIATFAAGAAASI